MSDFEALLAEGEAAPVHGWDFGWFDGRATEERPSWHYSSLLPPRLARAGRVLDLQTGGGEVFAGALAATDSRPQTIVATESWPPNLALARTALAPYGGEVLQLADTDPLPRPDGSFDLVLARHPTRTPWNEIARVLRPGGIFLSQQVVGLATNRELYEFLLGPQPSEPEDGLRAIRGAARDAGLERLDLRYEESRVEFFDVAAIVVFLRKVLWTVPGFTVDRYREKLLELHRIIERDGAFVSYSRHALVEARA